MTVHYPTGEERLYLNGLSDARVRAIRKVIEEKKAPFAWLRMRIAYERKSGQGPLPAISSGGTAGRFLFQVVPEVFDDTQENVLVLALDTVNRPVAVAIPHRGARASSMIEMASLFLPVVLAAPATAIIVAHNHPSGRILPSGEDRDIWERMRRAGEILGFRVLDFLVLARGPGGTPAVYSLAMDQDVTVS